MVAVVFELISRSSGSVGAAAGCREVPRPLGNWCTLAAPAGQARCVGV